MDEVWRDVHSLAHVRASSLGRVKVGPYEQPMPYGGVKVVEGRPTYGFSENEGDPKGRLLMMFRRHTYKVARLVYEAFHGPAPEGLGHCLHRDEDARNNKPENLYWGTQKENLNAPGFIAYCKARTGENNPYIKGRKARAACAI